MKILISNDDGIDSLGLKTLAERLAEDNEVLVVAPDGNRTASSHALSIRKSIKVIENFGFKNCQAFAISGTPVDCVKFARLHFKDFIPNVILSGINKGHNLGSDILYSGTVSIACEAAFFGNVAFAFSAFSTSESDFEIYTEYAVKIIELLLPLSNSGDIWNVNFPKEKLGIKGVKVTPLGKQLYTDRYQPVGINEYMLVGELVNHDENPSDCDIEWIKKGYITVTPILLDKTDRERVDRVKIECERLL